MSEVAAVISRGGKTRTFGDILTETKGIGPGFDVCRLFLATGVMLTHSMQQAAADAIVTSPLFDLRYYLLPAFFALSGFLVWGSFLRIRNLTQFMTFRLLRIFPALIVEIVLSALILGPLVTSLPLDKYFSDPVFARYFWNVTGYIHYDLPGVFLTNHSRAVNGSLFTVPSEMTCYITLACLIAAGIAGRPKWMLVGLAAYQIALIPYYYLHKGSVDTAATDWKLFPAYFYAGALLFSYRERISHSVALWILALLTFGVGIFLSNVVLVLLGPISIAFVINWLGLLKLPRVPLLMSGDYSYGIYIYGFPIQQTFFWLFPGSSWWTNMLLSYPLTCLFAAFSWWFVEKPFLRLRRLLFPAGPRSTEAKRGARERSLAEPSERFEQIEKKPG